MEMEDILGIVIVAYIVFLIAMALLPSLSTTVMDARGNESINCVTHPLYDSAKETDTLACAVTGILPGIWIVFALMAVWGTLKTVRYLARPQGVY